MKFDFKGFDLFFKNITNLRTNKKQPSPTAYIMLFTKLKNKPKP